MLELPGVERRAGDDRVERAVKHLVREARASGRSCTLCSRMCPSVTKGLRARSHCPKRTAECSELRTRRSTPHADSWPRCWLIPSLKAAGRAARKGQCYRETPVTYRLGFRHCSSRGMSTSRFGMAARWSVVDFKTDRELDGALERVPEAGVTLCDCDWTNGRASDTCVPDATSKSAQNSGHDLGLASCSKTSSEARPW